MPLTWMPPPSTPTWQPVPLDEHEKDIGDYQIDALVTGGGAHVAYVQEFWYACYANALCAATGEWTRGGAFLDAVSAMQWAERMAGVHPAKPGDAR